MAYFQRFNKRTGAWVKFQRVGKTVKIVNVKQKHPLRAFKGVPRKE